MKILFSLLCLLIVYCFTTEQVFASQDTKWNDYLERLILKLDPKYAHDLWTLYPEIASIDYLTIEQCYDGYYIDSIFNLFDQGMKMIDVANFYYNYEAQAPDLIQVDSLVHSVEHIIRHVIDCSTVPKSFRLGFTNLSDKMVPEKIVSTWDVSWFEKPFSWTNFMHARFGFENMSFVRNLINNIVNRLKFYWGIDTTKRVDQFYKNQRCEVPEDFEVPESLDWREMGAVSPVKDQGSCGSCWAFAPTATMESALLKLGNATETQSDLSEQQLLNFVKEKGCDGGFTWESFEYIKQKGQTSENECPYLGFEDRFDYDKYSPVATISEYCFFSIYDHPITPQPQLSPEQLQKAIAYFGPVTTLIYSSTFDFYNYKNGLLNIVNCPNERYDHMVTIVGYDQFGWIAKNSWGIYWGDEGYFRITKGINMCDIESEHAFPLL